MTDDTPAADEVLAQIRSLKMVPEQPAVEGQVQTAPLEVDGFEDLDSFFDDSLALPIRGKVYRIPPADPMLGLLCSRLILAGDQAANGQRIDASTKAVLDDAEETDLYMRLLGHTPDAPDYSPDRDVWQQMHDDGLDWQRIQFVGATAMIWTGVGKAAAQAFWKSGARPKASEAPTPPRQPQDRKAKGSGKSGRPGSTAGTTSRKRRQGTTTSGGTSSDAGD
jgi:hypothetical protein